MAVAKKEYLEKFASVIAAKKAYFETTKPTATVTASGLAYKITQKGTGIKPADGATFNFNYAGYFEDGTLFDSSYEDVCKAYGKFDANRAAQNGYRAFPFQAGKKEGLIPGFIEGLDQMTYGDKAIIFIPSKLAYGERGAGGVIPPNTNIIFELEMIEVIPEVAKSEVKIGKDEIIKKLKEKALNDWPNNYSTQEYWVNKQIEDYEYMLKIDNNPIKEKAEKDWPLDFSTQKYWYNQQIESKERMK
jgi:FKBP-type peptidyl-prolyl cis-trans isomerase